jgi:hypothetical protein
VIVLGMCTIMVSRRWALAPMLLMACMVAPAQRIVIASLDFDLIRIIILFGWARIILRREYQGLRWKRIDTLVVAWALASAAAMVLLKGTVEVMINRSGMMFDAIGMYFLFRLLVRDWSDVTALAKFAAVLSVPVAAVFIFEQFTGRNMFSIFGGVPETTVIRAGRLRCQGPFPHPILAGCFWAALMPLIVSLWFTRRDSRWLAPIGVVASTVIIVTTASSTPLSAFVFAALAVGLFPLRRYVRSMRWLGVFVLVELHLLMIQPVWHILARIDLVSGSTGWYRYKLIDDFIMHFSDWWMIGTESREGWFDGGVWAITNEFVAQGVNGGLLGLLLFVAIIAVSFRGVGQLSKLMSRANLQRQTMVWGLGAGLLVHCVAFLGVTYFGQIVMLWYLSLAMIGSLCPPSRTARPAVRLRRSPMMRLRRKSVRWRVRPVAMNQSMRRAS